MQWIAIYKDNTEHTEDELKSSEQIDRSQLKEFRLFSGNKLMFIAKFTDGKRKLIYRKRTFQDLSGSVKGVVYLVGWHEEVNGTSVKSICYVYDDHVEFDDARNDIELVPCEM